MKFEPSHLILGTEWLERDLPPVHYIVKPWLTEGGIALIYAEAGVSKTNVAMDLALAIGDGSPFLDFEVPRARRVLYVDGEMQRNLVQGRMRKFHNHTPRLRGFANLAWLNYADVGGIPDLGREDAEGREFINDGLLMHRADVLILDNKSSLMSGDENSAEAFEIFARWILSIRAKGITTLIIHHAGKRRADGTLSQRGSSRLTDVLDVTVQLTKGEVQGGVIPMTWTFEKHRSFTPDERHPKTFELAMHYDDDAKLAWLERTEPLEAGKEAPEWATSACQLRAAGMSWRDIGQQLGVSHMTVKRWVARVENPVPSAEG